MSQSARVEREHRDGQAQIGPFVRCGLTGGAPHFKKKHFRVYEVASGEAGHSFPLCAVLLQCVRTLLPESSPEVSYESQTNTNFIVSSQIGPLLTYSVLRVPVEQMFCESPQCARRKEVTTAQDFA